MNRMTRLGLIEDNRDFRDEVAFQLKHAGFEIILESDGQDIEARLAENPCDILILDLGLPAEDGLVIAHKARENHPSLGIIMLTARGSLEARIEGLKGGADIYLVKPVDMRELVAALHSLERRLGGDGNHTLLKFWQLDRLTQTLTTPSGSTIELTVRETALIAQLAESRDRPASRKTLARAIGEDRLDFDDRRLEVAFSRLRLKIEQIEPGAKVIRPARGSGYRFAAPLQVRN